MTTASRQPQIRNAGPPIPVYVGTQSALQTYYDGGEVAFARIVLDDGTHAIRVREVGPPAPAPTPAPSAAPYPPQKPVHGRAPAHRRGRWLTTEQIWAVLAGFGVMVASCMGFTAWQVSRALAGGGKPAAAAPPPHPASSSSGSGVVAMLVAAGLVAAVVFVVARRRSVNVSVRVDV